MGRHEENGNSRRKRVAFERLRDKVRLLPPEAIERANGLVMRNELWVRKYAWEFIGQWRHRLGGIPFHDVHQAAFLGAVRASYTWHPSKGAFTYWAWYWMRKEMQSLMYEAEPWRLILLEDDRGNVVLESPHVSAGEEAESLEYAAKVRGIVGSFPRTYRGVLDDLAEGVKVKDTAARMGVSRRQVSIMRGLALAWLRHRLGEGPEPDRGMLPGRSEDEPVVHTLSSGGHDDGGGA